MMMSDLEVIHTLNQDVGRVQTLIKILPDIQKMLGEWRLWRKSVVTESKRLSSLVAATNNAANLPVNQSHSKAVDNNVNKSSTQSKTETTSINQEQKRKRKAEKVIDVRETEAKGKENSKKLLQGSAETVVPKEERHEDILQTSTLVEQRSPEGTDNCVENVSTSKENISKKNSNTNHGTSSARSENRCDPTHQQKQARPEPNKESKLKGDDRINRMLVVTDGSANVSNSKHNLNLDDNLMNSLPEDERALSICSQSTIHAASSSGSIHSVQSEKNSHRRKKKLQNRVEGSRSVSRSSQHRRVSTSSSSSSDCVIIPRRSQKDSRHPPSRPRIDRAASSSSTSSSSVSPPPKNKKRRVSPSSLMKTKQTTKSSWCRKKTEDKGSWSVSSASSSP